MENKKRIEKERYKLKLKNEDNKIVFNEDTNIVLDVISVLFQSKRYTVDDIYSFDGVNLTKQAILRVLLGLCEQGTVVHVENSNPATFFNIGIVTPKYSAFLAAPKNSQKSRPPKRKSISKSIRHEVFKRDEFKCVECGATKEDTRLHIDHILPVSQGGSDELDNLQTLCEECNLAKSNRKWEGGC